MRAGDRVLTSVQDIAPAVEVAKHSFDQERRLPAQLIEQMKERQFFHLWLPCELGGPALGLTESIRVIEELAKLDGAVGWCAAIATTYSRLGAFLPRSTAERIFVNEKAVVAGSFIGGEAEVTKNGYRLSGRIPYSSGIHHCAWAVGGGPVFADGRPRLLADGQQEGRTLLYPVGSVDILDTWNVSGLRGTGSHDHIVKDLFVPEEQTVLFHGQTTDCAGGLFRIPAYTTYPAVIAAVPLGIARTGVDLFYKLADTKNSRNSSSLLKDDTCAQMMLGRAEATLRSARSFLFEMAEELDDASEARTEITVRQRMLMRLASANVADGAKAVIQIVHEVAGGSALYQQLGIERCFRDIHAAVQHVQVQNLNFRWAAREFMGLPPEHSRF